MLRDHQPLSWVQRMTAFVHNPSAFRWLKPEIYLFFLALLAGLIGGGAAVLFIKAIEVVQSLAYGQVLDLSLIFARRDVPLWRYWLMPLLGAALLSPIVWLWVPQARGAGISEILESVRLHHGGMKRRLFLGKLLASALSLGTIASVGREGPVIAIASSLGANFNHWFKIPKRYWNVMIACAGAAAISATFNTPIAGAFFMAEVILGSFSMEHFPAIILASVLGTVIGQSVFGDHPAFALPAKFALNHPLELFAFIVLGLLAGATAMAFVGATGWIRARFDQIPGPVWLRPLIGALLLILMGLYICPNVVGNGYASIEHLIGAQSHPELFRNGIWFLLFLMLMKTLAVGISLGAGYSGGVFVPALFMGAPLGYLMGLLAQSMAQPYGLNIAPETYAVIGMAAVFTGISKAPISAIIMIFEMTQNYQLMLPLMAACVLSYILSETLYPESIYTQNLVRKGIHLSELNEEHLIMHHYTVSDLMRQDEEPVIHADTSVQEAVRIMLKYHRHDLFLIDHAGLLKGILTLAHLKSYLLGKNSMYDPVSNITEPQPVCVFPDLPLTEVMRIFWHTHLEELPVIEPHTQKLLGVIWERDIIGLYNSEILKQHDALSFFKVQEGEQHNYEHLELPEGYMMKKVPVLEQWQNQQIMDLALRQKYGINILTIERSVSNGAVVSLPPTGQELLTEDDQVVMMGPRESIEALLRELGLLRA